MAESDILFKTFVVRNVLPICAILVGLYILKRNKKMVNGIVSAYLLNRFVPTANKATKREKEKLFSELFDQQGDLDTNLMILEIGAGGGANFEFYPPKSIVTCLDPNRHFDKYLLENSKKYELNVKFLKGFAEKMDGLENNMFDAVVCTLVLCTVDSKKTLQEVRRVLKPGGKFYFLEHVAAEKGSIVSFIQRLLNPVWRRILGGCQIIKDTGETVKNAGFSHTRITPFSGKFPFVFVVRPLCMGIATK